MNNDDVQVEINQKNATALAQSLQSAHNEIGLLQTQIKHQTRLIHEHTQLLVDMKNEMLIMKVMHIGNGPSED